jgi:hypothetical protein
LFLDLELLTVDELGFWEQLYDDAYQPETYFEIPTYGESVYGSLPCVWYSKDVRRMFCAPSGPATIDREPDSELPAAKEIEPVTPSANRAPQESELKGELPSPEKPAAE